MALQSKQTRALPASMREAALAIGFSELARRTGLSRATVHRALSPTGNPRLDSILRIVDALGLHVAVLGPLVAPRESATRPLVCSKDGKGTRGMIDLYSDASVMDTLKRAAQGDRVNAWWAIAELEVLLRTRRLSAPLFDYAADFFGALLDTREDVDDGSPAEKFAPTLRKLFIVRGPGRPVRNEEESRTLAARVALLIEAGLHADRAFVALDGWDGYGRRSYRTAYEAHGRIMTRMHAIVELESMAGWGLEPLLKALNQPGRIDNVECRSAIAAARRSRSRGAGAPES